MNSRIPFQCFLPNLTSNMLSFSITICPYEQKISPSCLFLYVGSNCKLVLYWDKCCSLCKVTWRWNRPLLPPHERERWTGYLVEDDTNLVHNPLQTSCPSYGQTQKSWQPNSCPMSDQNHMWRHNSWWTDFSWGSRPEMSEMSYIMRIGIFTVWYRPPDKCPATALEIEGFSATHKTFPGIINHV